MSKTYSAAVIGSTGKGGYGHRLDTAFDIDGVELVAIADHDLEGLTAAGERLGVSRLYHDYRQMLETEKPDFVSIAPSWVTERVPMIEAAAAAGCHIYCEKPVAGSLVEVDTIVAACQSAKVKMAVAHQWRAMLPVQKIIKDVKVGKFGKLLRVRTRPKDDSRGGGEELLLHGTHLFDLMMAFAGEPRWASGHVTVDNRDATTEDTGQGNAPVGPIIGDSISAIFGFDNGVRGFFDSTAGLAIPGESNFDNLYGLSLECERASLELREPGDVYIYPVPRVLPDLRDLAWERVWMPEWHERPEHAPDLLRKNWLNIGNKTLARDLIDAAEADREPLSSIRMVRFVNEMVQGVYSSHLLSGQRIAIPLTERAHPLGEL
jgi:predicted dehydrogenase